MSPSCWSTWSGPPPSRGRDVTSLVPIVGQTARESVMRILVLSDVHANLVALETVLRDAGRVDDVWSVGDIVGYGPRPRECVELVRVLAPHISVIGNHDWASI